MSKTINQNSGNGHLHDYEIVELCAENCCISWPWNIGHGLASIGLENTEANRQAYRTLLVTVPGLGECISGAILFEETLYQSTTDGTKIVDVLVEQNIVPGIKVDKVRSTPFQWFMSRE